MFALEAAEIFFLIGRIPLVLRACARIGDCDDPRRDETVEALLEAQRFRRGAVYVAVCQQALECEFDRAVLVRNGRAAGIGHAVLTEMRARQRCLRLLGHAIDDTLAFECDFEIAADSRRDGARQRDFDPEDALRRVLAARGRLLCIDAAGLAIRQRGDLIGDRFLRLNAKRHDRRDVGQIAGAEVDLE